MPTPSSVAVTPGSGALVATREISESAQTKELQRINIDDVAGTAMGTQNNPFITAPPVNAIYPQPISFGNSNALDAFYRLRVSEPFTQFDSQNQYDISPNFWFVTTSGTGAASHLPNESSVQLSTGGTSSGAFCYRVTKEYFRYQPGKSHLITMTALLGIAKTNVRQRVGEFDTGNGNFFEQTSAGMSVVQRSSVSGSPSDTVSPAATIPQAGWNVDKCDGTGVSGFNLDTTKTQIFFIDKQWLGVGRVRMGFFNEVGVPIVCHQFENANAFTTVYKTTANLPVQFQIENTGNTASLTTMKAICASVVTEGGFENEGASLYTTNNGATALSVTSRRAILSIRPKATFNSITNRAKISPIRFSIAPATNDCLWEVVYNPTFTGTPVWADVDTSNSAVERSVHADAANGAFSGGIVLDSGYTEGAGGGHVTVSDFQISFPYPIVLDPSGANPIAVSLVCTSLNATSSDSGSITWKEFK